MFKAAESRPDKIESTSNNVHLRKKQQHRRRACDLLASLKRFYWPNTRKPMCLNLLIEIVKTDLKLYVWFGQKKVITMDIVNNHSSL